MAARTASWPPCPTSRHTLLSEPALSEPALSEPALSEPALPDRPVRHVAVVTVVHGRHQHLRAQRALLARCVPPPAVHVVVAIDDAAIEQLAAEDTGLATLVVTLPTTTTGGLPIAAARNAGARAALDHGADALVLLDVDCLPSPSLLGDYAAALVERPDAIVCGPVTYLPPGPDTGWSVDALRAHRSPHPARPDPPTGTYAPIPAALFWSLSFAVRATTWRRIGGFFEGYVGYGGEDTDLGFVAAAAGIEILFHGGADAYHQFHPVEDPPVGHLDDILRNSAIFRRRHGVLPMAGWLAGFADRDLIETVDGLPRRRDAIRLLTVPARHPYLDAALPTTVTRVATDRVVAWEPDPLLSPDAFDAAAADVDVVHVHFSYEHLDPGELRRWLDVLERRRVALVLTVHDLRNPHLADPARHTGQLKLLADAAARVITLTHTAAAQVAELFGRSAVVVPHPTLLDEPVPSASAVRDGVLIPLKALRANVPDAPRLVEVVADAASRSGCRTAVLLDPSARGHRDFDAVLGLGGRTDVEVALAGHVPHAEVVATVAGARVIVLPYRFGTHSGWIELARDAGTTIVVPDCGAFAEQGDNGLVYHHDEETGLDEASLAAAVHRACEQCPPPPADRGARLAQRDLVRATHEAIYRAVRGR